LGAIKNFELAALQTSGSYVAFCDQDDIWMPTKLEKLYSAIKGYSLVYSDSLLIDDEGKRLNRRLSDIRNMYSGTDERTFILSNSVSGHSMMIKRELLKKAFPIPKNVFHDHWLAINAASSSGIFFLNETLTFYRQHEKNVTQIELNKTPPARSFDKRYIDYKNLVSFVELIAQIEGVNKKWFYNKLLALLKLKEKRKFVWPLFFFLLKHQEILFYVSKKNTLSRLIEIRKLSRGEKFSS
jgi:glycosyltransferase involved in cell wall biosynthesis